VQFRISIEDAIGRLWPRERNVRADLAPNLQAGDSVYFAINALSPGNDAQQKVKTLAETYAGDLAQLRALLVAQSQSSASVPMLIVVVCWLVVIFGSFGLLAPANRTANLALLFSSLAVAGAIFLLLELDTPFDGLIRIPSREMVTALNQLLR